MATKHKRIKSPTNGGGVDHISKLPDEILHNILRRSTERRAEPPRTAILSRRWRSVMSSYPAVQFRSTRRRRNENFQKFVYTTLKRFSLHKLMRMETLDIWLKGEEGSSSDLVNLLLKLAAERKSREISLRSDHRECIICLPLRIIADSGAEILRLRGEQLYLTDSNSDSDSPLFLSSMRCLDLDFINDQLFTTLLARCHLLETLEIRLFDSRKIQISNVPNLKTLRIFITGENEEVDVEAPGLQNLRLCGFFSSVRKMELKAPQLKHLEIDLAEGERKLKLSIPKLKVFKLQAEWTLEKIELDAGPTLSRFILDLDSPDGLRKCEIDNAIACRFEVNFTMCETRPSYLGLVKSFIDRFPQFQTVSITNLDSHNVIFDLERKNPTAIKHLKYCTKNCHERTPLKALFRVFRPKFLTIMNESRNSGMFFLQLLEEMSQNFDGKERENSMWYDRLKDVKIVTRYVDREEEELIDVLKAGLVTTKKEFCFALTWN